MWAKVVGLLVQQLRGLGDDHRPLGIALVPPGLETGLGRRQLGLVLRCVDVVEVLDQLAVEGAEALVGHGWLCFRGGWVGR